VRLLEVELDRGEAEAIALALEIRADLLLLDETDARRVAERVGLRVTGVLGVLLRAKERREIGLVRPELEALRNQARFFRAKTLEQQMLEIAGE
jgi:predicted nucleic acid-binding protein